MPTSVQFTPVLIATLSIDVFGIIVGLISIAIMIRLRKTVGGRIGEASVRFIIGVICIMLALIWTIVFTRLKLMAAPTYDIHHLLMTLGMILFVLSAKKLASLLQ